MKRKGIFYTDKKAFSLMEVIIATALLSVVMISLFQVKSNNIFIVEKTNESKKQKDYISLAIDTKDYSKKNKNIYLSRIFNIKDDDLRREFKEVKIKIKEEFPTIRIEKVEDISIKISNYKTKYSFENGISKDIYSFEIEL
ncbi:MAG: prepilin-type N-terminal cleavage/methylation domain-containing protein [Arcobacter sp.]|nr:prepilin-type N-terminal cleavage/methylation domain-containing protein [Arcobacter sp.]